MPQNYSSESIEHGIVSYGIVNLFWYGYDDVMMMMMMMMVLCRFNAT